MHLVLLLILYYFEIIWLKIISYFVLFITLSFNLYNIIILIILIYIYIQIRLLNNRDIIYEY